MSFLANLAWAVLVTTAAASGARAQEPSGTAPQDKPAGRSPVRAYAAPLPSAPESVNETFTVSVVGAFANPDTPVAQATGRTKSFAYGMVYVAYGF